MREKIEGPDWSKCPNCAEFAVFNQAGEGYWGYSCEIDDIEGWYIDEVVETVYFDNTVTREKDVVLDKIQYRGSRDIYERHVTLPRNNPPRRKRWWE